LDAAECVNATVQASQNRKYKVKIFEEAVISKYSSKSDSMMVCFKDKGVKIINLESLNLKE